MRSDTSSKRQTWNILDKIGLHNIKSVVYSCEIKRNYKKKQPQDM